MTKTQTKTQTQTQTQTQTKTQTKKYSVLNLNTFLNNDNDIKSLKKKSSKKSLPKLTNISLDILQKIYKLDIYKDTITSFYSLNNPIITYLVQYNDNESKRLVKEGLDNLELVPSYKFSDIDIEDNLKTIDLTFKIHQNLLKELKLKDIPKIVKYASEDFTRGIRGFIDARYKHLPINVSNGFVKLWEILHIFKLMENNDNTTNPSKRTFNVFHIAEAPGQMILCAKYYAERKNHNITNYDWRANSLNPYNYEVKTKFGGLRDDYKLIRNNPQKWLWGADNT